MPRQIIDISVALEADIASDPPIMLPKITYMKGADTAEQVASFFPGLKPEDLPNREGWAIEFLEIATHNGTHLDAPVHFAEGRWPQTPFGRRPLAVDRWP